MLEETLCLLSTEMDESGAMALGPGWGTANWIYIREGECRGTQDLERGVYGVSGSRGTLCGCMMDMGL